MDFHHPGKGLFQTPLDGQSLFCMTKVFLPLFWTPIYDFANKLDSVVFCAEFSGIISYLFEKSDILMLDANILGCLMYKINYIYLEKSHRLRIKYVR